VEYVKPEASYSRPCSKKKKKKIKNCKLIIRVSDTYTVNNEIMYTYICTYTIHVYEITLFKIY